MERQNIEVDRKRRSKAARREGKGVSDATRRRGSKVARRQDDQRARRREDERTRRQGLDVARPQDNKAEQQSEIKAARERGDEGTRGVSSSSSLHPCLLVFSSRTRGQRNENEKMRTSKRGRGEQSS